MTGSGDSHNRRIEDLKLDQRVISLLQEEWGINELFPPQAEALSHSLKGRSIMLAAPTASGKSLVAHLTIIHRLTTDLKGNLALYIVPLKALASEKMTELKEIAGKVGLKVGLAIGDRGGETSMIEKADILVCTSEKLDSIMRNRSELMNRVGIVTCDEFHIIDNFSRGPTLEIVLSRLRYVRPETQVIALSATVGNADDIAKWLKADLVLSNWRPISLQYGTITSKYENLELEIHRIDGPANEENPEIKLVENKYDDELKFIFEDSINDQGQLLIFVGTRASTKKVARELSAHVREMLKKDIADFKDTKIWHELSTKIIVSENTTDTVKHLREYLECGIAFHHAGLSMKHRKLVEEGFKSGSISCIVATPTLAQGINLPSRTVVVRDFKRWDDGKSSVIPVREILQMMGRAGRPKYDKRGKAWIIAYDKEEGWNAENLAKKYFHGKVEDLVSKLSDPKAESIEEDTALLSHVLSAISTAGTTDRDSIDRFFSNTLLSRQVGREILVERIDNAISWLVSNGMIERRGDSEKVKQRILERGPENESEDWEDDLPAWVKTATKIEGLELSVQRKEWKYAKEPRKGPAIFGFRKASEPDLYQPEPPESPTMEYKSTTLGKRITQLYLDPVSGRTIRDGIDRAMAILSNEDKFGEITPLSLLHLVSATRSIRPLRIRQKEEDKIIHEIKKHEREFLVQNIDDEEGRMKVVLILEEWIDERDRGLIEDEWGVMEGDINGMCESAERILYAMRRIIAEDKDVIIKNKNSYQTLVQAIDETYVRVKNGCKADLIDLVSIKNIGRRRARQMINELSVESATDVSLLTERDRNKLADLSGWSQKLVDNIVNEAKRISK